MKTTKIGLIDKNIEEFDGDILVYFMPEIKENKFTYLTTNSCINSKIELAYKLGDFSGKEGQILLFYPLDYKEQKDSKDNEKRDLDSKNNKEDKDLKSEAVVAAKRVLVVGIGKFNSGSSKIERSKNHYNEIDNIKFKTISKSNDYNFTYFDELREVFRKAGGVAASTAAKIKAKTALILIPDYYLDCITLADTAQSIAEGVLLGDYRFLKYKKEKPEEPHYEGLVDIGFTLENSTLKNSLASKNFTQIRKSLKLALYSSQAVYKARDMANEPGNCFTASDFASFATKLAKKYKLNCTIIDKDKMKELGMGGILAVNQGSSEPPKMVVLEYQPKKDKKKRKKEKNQQDSNSEQSQNLNKSQDLIFEQSKEKIATILLVGKGITFDSGGICLKQPSGMEDMKYDMCGGAAVLAVMQAVGEEMPDNVGVVAIVPATDNLSGSSAIKPGDIIRHYNGVTSEIVNTDAEGRMVLADAISYGIKTFNPACVIDIATLTGAVIMGLGHHCSAIVGNSDELIQQLITAANRAGEPLWRLPLGKEYAKQIESKVADIKNTGGKAAGTITAAAYLEHFVGNKTPWAHIDIAGTAWEFTEKSYIPKGASGIGVRTFLEFIRNWH